MKYYFKLFILLITLVHVSFSAYGQWDLTGNNILATDFFGTTNNFPINIQTASVPRAQFTILNGIGAGFFGDAGTGMRIFPGTAGCAPGTGPSAPTSSLDLYTTCGNQTHIRFDGSGQIGGYDFRFRQWANYNGFLFNAFGGAGYQPRYIFQTQGAEQARVGVNRFWRIGENPLDIDAARRLEVVEYNTNTPQLRLTRNVGIFTDFETNNAGNLRINPRGQRVGINLAFGVDPSHNLEVDGNVRIRNVPIAAANCILVGTNITGAGDNQVSRLNFTGNSNQVLLGNATWGTFPTGIGNYCGQASNPILSNYEIPLSNFNYYFSGQGNNGTVSSIGIGYSCTPVLPAKLAVLQNSPVLFTGTNSVAIAGINEDLSSLPQQQFFGVSGTSLQLDPSATTNLTRHIGGFFNANGGFTNVGVAAFASDVNPSAGFNAAARVEFLGPLNPTETYYGIFSRVPASTGTTTTFAGWFDGDVFINSPTGVSGVGYVLASDQQFKTNIDTINNALGIIAQLNPKTYYFDTIGFNQIHFSGQKQFGVIAQDLETVLPELITNQVFPAQLDSLGNVISPAVNYKGVNYNAFNAILIKGIQEQQSEINHLETKLAEQDSINNSLQDQINTLYGMITSCCSNNAIANPNNNSQAVTNVALNDAKTVVLDQNVPNPFSEMTTITYTLNDGVNKAQLLFYNIEGKLINSLDISNQSGKGQVNVFANDLSTGIYTYTLIVDGKVIDTKKMVKQ